MAEYENRVALMSQEIERLNGALRAKVDELSSWEAKWRALQQENETLRRSQSQLESKLRDELKVNVSNYEEKFRAVSL